MSDARTSPSREEIESVLPPEMAKVVLDNYRRLERDEAELASLGRILGWLTSLTAVACLVVALASLVLTCYSLLDGDDWLETATHAAMFAFYAFIGVSLLRKRRPSNAPSGRTRSAATARQDGDPPGPLRAALGRIRFSIYTVVLALFTGGAGLLFIYLVGLHWRAGELDSQQFGLVREATDPAAFYGLLAVTAVAGLGFLMVTPVLLAKLFATSEGRARFASSLPFAYAPVRPSLWLILIGLLGFAAYALLFR